MEYQVGKYGKEIRFVNPAFTSMICARCGYVKKDLTLADRIFVCPSCGWTVDRDYNASLNILSRSGSERPLVPVELRPLPLASLGYEAGSHVR
ncbi:hypothetical protein SiH_0570 [Sulfolobus islandicus HVE10/4]|nr:hypothetical protein SiH_0570 [Sulfolobus islandicus HVE10/4]